MARKLVHVLSGPAVRGAETFALDLAEALTEYCIEQKILFVRGQPTKLPDGYPIDVAYLPETRKKIGSLRWLRRALAELGPSDIILCHGQTQLKYCVAALAFRRRKDRPTVAMKKIGHSLPWITKLRKIRVALGAWVLEWADICIALGPSQEDELMRVFGVPQSRLTVIPNGRKGPRPGSFAPGTGQGGATILMVGSISREKNIEGALRVFEAVKASCPDAKLRCIGDGPLRPKLAAEASRRFPEGSVEFPGYRERPLQEMSEATVLLLCSHTEGVPGVIIEASFVGLPTVAWDVGDVGAVLEDGRNGSLVPFGDEEQLAAALIAVLSSDQVRETLSTGAADRAGSFRIESVATLYASIFGFS